MASGITSAYKTMLATLSAYQPVAALGGKVDCALFNRNRNTAEWSARFPMNLCIFGDTQTDGAGVANPLYYFAVVARMKLAEELDEREWDFLELNEAVKTLFHRRRWNSAYSTIWQKSMIFYSSMTLTNESRRFQVKLADDEVGLGVFFYASPLTVAALASTATVASATNDTGLSGFTPSSTDPETGEETDGTTTEEAETPSATETALAAKSLSGAAGLF